MYHPTADDIHPLQKRINHRILSQIHALLFFFLFLHVSAEPSPSLSSDFFSGFYAGLTLRHSADHSMSALIYTGFHNFPQYNPLILQHSDVPVFQDILLFQTSEIHSDILSPFIS